MFQTWKIIRMSTYIWLNVLTIIVFEASKEMILSYGFMVRDDDVLFVIIILEIKFQDLNLCNRLLKR